MSPHCNSIFLACFSLFMIAVPLTSLTVAAEDSYNLNIGVSGTQPEAPAVALPEQTAVSETTTKKSKKKVRKEAGEDEGLKEFAPNIQMTVSQVMSILRTSRDLSGLNLSGLSLVGLNMSRANLKGANLSKTNLERADFTESNLERVDFKGANLKMTSFFQSAITAADMKGAVLDNAIWVDKRVCAEGSIGQCLEKPAVVQPAQTASSSQPIKPEPQQPATQTSAQPEQQIQPIQPPVAQIQPVQPPVMPEQTQQQESSK